MGSGVPLSSILHHFLFIVEHLLWTRTCHFLRHPNCFSAGDLQWARAKKATQTHMGLFIENIFVSVGMSGSVCVRALFL